MTIFTKVLRAGGLWAQKSAYRSSNYSHITSLTMFHEMEEASVVTTSVVLVGDATVGKTHLLSRYIKGTLPRAPTATIGVEFATRTVPLAVGGTVKAQIW